MSYKMLLGAAAPAALVLSLAAAPASAAVVLSGDTRNAGTQLFDRPVANGAAAPTALSGQQSAYAVYQFNATVGGSYAFQVNPLSVDFNPFLVLYTGSFNPAEPLTNALQANDNSFEGTLAAGFTRALTAGTTYVAVITGANSTTGAFALDVTAPGTAAVPEAGTWAMMLLGFGMAGAGLRQRRRAAVRFA